VCPLVLVLVLVSAGPSRDNHLYLSWLLARRGGQVRVNEHHQYLTQSIFFLSPLLSRVRPHLTHLARHSLSRNRCPQRSLSPSLVIFLFFLYLGRHSHLAARYHGYIMGRLFIMHICVMALCRDTTNVDAGKADVYSLRVVLQTE
jgi:hypothetical protein